MELKIIANIKSDFTQKFGIPRQSGVVENLKSEIIFTKEFQNPVILRGLEGFSHLWLIWEFSENVREKWSPTVRPPRLGGNKRLGVFATRSPFRPNPIGLSCVKIEEIILNSKEGIKIIVSGADLMNGTPIYDIKPYLPYADCKPDAIGGFANEYNKVKLRVDFPKEELKKIHMDKRDSLIETLSLDPRPSYQNDRDRVYTMAFGENEIKFTVDNENLYVKKVEKKA